MPRNAVSRTANVGTVGTNGLRGEMLVRFEGGPSLASILPRESASQTAVYADCGVNGGCRVDGRKSMDFQTHISVAIIY